MLSPLSLQIHRRARGQKNEEAALCVTNAVMTLTHTEHSVTVTYQILLFETPPYA